MLQPSDDDQNSGKGAIDSIKNLSSHRADSEDNSRKREENQMRRRKWYSPQLSREVVTRLYFRTKAERIPMTVLANKIIQAGLGTEPLPKCNISDDTKTESPVGS